MGDCEEKDLDFDYKPPQPEEEEEVEKKKKVEIKSSSSSSSSDDKATNIETLVGDLQNLSLKGNENNNSNSNNQIDDNNPDHVTSSSTNETLEEEEEEQGGELLQNHHLIIISSTSSAEEEEEEGGGVETRMISQISTNLVRFFKKEKNDDDDKPVVASHDTTTLDGEELQNPSSEGEQNQRDHDPSDDDDDIKTQNQTLTLTLDDGELHNLSSEWNETPQKKDTDHHHHPTTIETLDGELLHNNNNNNNNPEVEEEETNLITSSSEWNDGWDGNQKDDNPPNLIPSSSSSEWVDGTQKDNTNKPEEEEEEEEGEETIFKEEKRRIFQYPLRPDEPDCVFYLRTGSCRYGFHCKFNHPPRKKHQLKASSHLSDSSFQRLEPITAIEVVKEKEREREDYTQWPGKIECKYHRTPGGCKFGKACRYYHPQEKNVAAPPTEFNFLGLPIRPGEKECPFFMRTGSCKFATSCRFHHPDPTDAVESDPLSGYHDAESVELHSERSPQPHVTSWSLPRTYNETAPYMDTSSSYPTGIVSPSQAHQNREWNGYQVPARYSSEGNRNPQSASLMNHSTRKANNSMHQQQQMVVDEFPERPGQHECQYYMKHGDCKYRSACRFHHPKNYSNYSTNSPVLSSIGLPLRPDQIICSNYSRFGICKYGPSCKYDHPV